MFSGTIHYKQEYIYDKQFVIFEQSPLWSNVEVGEVVSINGVGLTLLSKGVNGSIFHVPQVNTNLPLRRVANVERSFRVGKRNRVTGNVCGTATVRSIFERSDGVRSIWFDCPSISFTIRQIIVLDGVLLPVNKIDTRGFMVTMVPSDWDPSTFAECAVGDIVNVEIV